MAEAHPTELRDRVVRAYEAGEGGYAAVGARFAVGAATVMRWVRIYRAKGDTDPLPKGGGTPSTISADEMTAEFNRGRRGRARLHVSSMKRALHRHGYVVKKNADGRWRVCAPTS